MKKILKWIHLAIVISTTWAVGIYFLGEADGLGSVGAGCLRYFTTDSNILACLGSLLYLIFSDTQKRTKGLRLFRFAGTVSVTVTLLTVILFLGPVAAVHGRGLHSFLSFFEGNVFVLHFSTPVLSILALLLEKEVPPTKKEALVGVLPVFIYSIVYLIMVVVVKIWTDWYGFTFGGKLEVIPFVMVVMYAATAGIAEFFCMVKKKQKY